VQSLRLLATALAGAALALSTAPDRLASGLVGLGVPGGAAFLATTALRFVPVALEEWRVVREARAQRATVPAWRLDRRLLHELAVLRPVAARAIRRSATLAESLELRGFDPARAAVPGGRPARVAGPPRAGGRRRRRWRRWPCRARCSGRGPGGLVADPALRPWMALVRWAL
jgi:energy-coupling factor transporter transmembrane protein EcfT